MLCSLLVVISLYSVVKVMLCVVVSSLYSFCVVVSSLYSLVNQSNAV